ncbi:MAG TPA: inositol monophosphatase family protein [Aliidongia sp.]|nr:inositol monophosphatase family protein [Aliidongia sp.]
MISRLELHELIRPAVRIAREYADRRSTIASTEKSPGQFMSEADEAIEGGIRRHLAERFASIAVIGEEQGGSLGETTSGWAIDPIDGTTNFLRGLPAWGISIGLLENGVSVAGALALPDLDLTIIAVRGTGLEVNGHPFIRPKGSPGGKLIALGENDFESGDRTDARANELRMLGFSVVRYRSAVFSLACAALGRLDGYVEHGCCIWDIAAAAVICHEAGLSVTATPLGGERFAINASSQE